MQEQGAIQQRNGWKRVWVGAGVVGGTFAMILGTVALRGAMDGTALSHLSPKTLDALAIGGIAMLMGVWIYAVLRRGLIQWVKDAGRTLRANLVLGVATPVIMAIQILVMLGIDRAVELGILNMPSTSLVVLRFTFGALLPMALVMVPMALLSGKFRLIRRAER